jgi:hypothetical protein
MRRTCAYDDSGNLPTWNDSTTSAAYTYDNKRFYIMPMTAMHPQRGHWHRTPHFMVKISLTYKTAFPILHTIKRKFLSKKGEVLAVANVIEAIASHRPYRPSFGIEVALGEISRNKGKLYTMKVL